MHCLVNHSNHQLASRPIILHNAHLHSCTKLEIQKKKVVTANPEISKKNRFIALKSNQHLSTQINPYVKRRLIQFWTIEEHFINVKITTSHIMCVVSHWEEVIKVCLDHPENLPQFKVVDHKIFQNRTCLYAINQGIEVQEWVLMVMWLLSGRLYITYKTPEVLRHNFSLLYQTCKVIIGYWHFKLSLRSLIENTKIEIKVGPNLKGKLILKYQTTKPPWTPMSDQGLFLSWCLW